MLCNKANLTILERFLAELLGEEIKIKQILDSESNKEMEDDKFSSLPTILRKIIDGTKSHDLFQLSLRLQVHKHIRWYEKA